MNDVAIRVKGLSKCYQIYATPRDRLKQFILPRLRRLLRLEQKSYFREFWAARDVDFEIGRGETVGIIGRNGSGKSTLLQIICGTLAPTSGQVDTHGRVAALLELGSGFNPEFTGRENVYLNAMVLGLQKHEVDQRLPQILEFADIGDFIDQPVKTYSSGMFVRLAFAVIAHVDPEILVIDEALSVGDAFFQSKCASAMKAMIDKGTTVLFVSHDTHSVKSLCSRAILLEKGQIVAMGDANDVVEQYYSRLVASSPVQRKGDDARPALAPSFDESGEFDTRVSYQRIKNGRASFLDIALVDQQGQKVVALEFGQKVTLRMFLEAHAHIPEIGIAYHIRDMKGVELVYSDTGVEAGNHLRNLEPGKRYVIDWSFQVSLREGEYNFSAMASIPIDLNIAQVDVCDFIPFALQFSVSRGSSLPIYGAVQWDNVLSISELT